MIRVKLRKSFPTTLALGGDIACAPCFLEGNEAILADPLGDISLEENQISLDRTVKSILKTPPKLVVSDLHPGYFSTSVASRIAKEYDIPHKKIQHHMAHVASAASEHGLDEYAGIACDGLGLGLDDSIWGGEVFVFKKNVFNRIGSLETQPQMGGDAATIFPKKMLFGLLSRFLDREGLKRFFNDHEIDVGLAQLRQGFNVFDTTSTGRILDAVSALLGVCEKRTYEGQPAIELEKFSAKKGFDLPPKIDKKDHLILDTTHLFRYLVDNLDKDRTRLAATAHIYLARGMLEIARTAKLPIVFSGGVAYNRIISGYLAEHKVLLHKDIPPGDAGIAVGQAILANICKD